MRSFPWQVQLPQGAQACAAHRAPDPKRAPAHHQLQAIPRMPRNPQQLLVSSVLAATMAPPVRSPLHTVSQGTVRASWPEALAQRAGLQLQYRMRGFLTWSGLTRARMVRTICGRPGAPLQQMFQSALLAVTRLLQALEWLRLRRVTG
jgi:hypothetical protein